MKKKLLALCLAAALAAGLSGCGKKAPQPSPSPVPTAQPTLSPEEIAAQQAAYDPAGTVLAEGSGVKITVDALRWDQNGVTELDLNVENSGEEDAIVSAATSSVNGYMVQSVFSRTVPAQGAVADVLTLYTDELVGLGVTDLADLSVTFILSDDAGSYQALGPCVLTLPIASGYDYASSPLRRAMDDPAWVEASPYALLHAATDLCAQDGVALSAAYLLADPFGSRYLYLELENSGREPAEVELGDISLNGSLLTQRDFAHCGIDGGKRYLALLSLEPLIPAGAEGDYAQLREVGLTVNGAAATLSIPQ